MAEIFEPGMFSLGQALDHFVLHLPALRSWEDATVLEELGRMKEDGLVIEKDDGHRRGCGHGTD